MMTISYDELRQMAGHRLPTAIQEGVRYTTYREHMTNIRELKRRIHAVEAGVAFIAMDREAAPPTPLPAPALTEQAIVDALKADPAMAGRIIVEVAQTVMHGRQEIGRSAAEKLGPHPTTAALCLQSLAVALAAASYRG